MVTSPNYPNNYPSNLLKIYPIEVANASIIKISIDDMELESNDVCRYDYIEIEDGDGTVLLDKTCGSRHPAEIVSQTNTVKVIFKTDGDGSGKGWKITYYEGE